MRQQTDLPVCLLNLAIARSLLDGEDLVERSRGTSPYSNNFGLLLRGIFSILVALVVLSGSGRAICSGTGAGGRCGHAATVDGI